MEICWEKCRCRIELTKNSSQKILALEFLQRTKNASETCSGAMLLSFQMILEGQPKIMSYTNKLDKRVCNIIAINQITSYRVQSLNVSRECKTKRKKEFSALLKYQMATIYYLLRPLCFTCSYIMDQLHGSG